MEILIFIAPLLLNVFGNTVYNVAGKSTPEKINSFATLSLSYLTGLVLCVILFFVTNPGGDIFAAFASANWALNTLEGREEDVGAFGVRAFPTSHDVPCVGYRIHTPDGKTMSIATDLGTLTPPVHEALTGCDLVALESNYDLHMLRSGPYPYYLRARIESTRGHLSNDECAAKLLELIQEGCKKFALCHLSQENNTPSLALQTVFNTLGAAGVVPDRDCIVQAQRRSEVSPALEF